MARRSVIWIVVIVNCALGALFGLVLMTISCGSQPQLAVTGIVKDATTAKPISGAVVSDDGYGPKPYKGATTDSMGRYRYFTWHEEHSIVASALGYKIARQTLKTNLFQTDKEKVLDFSLPPE